MEILEKYFPGRVQWIDPTGNTRVEVTMTRNSNQDHGLRLYVPPDYPNSLPDMVVCHSPKSMRSGGSSGTTHTLRRRDGYLKICHYNPSIWNSEHTFYEIFVKGRVWFEAYEGCMANGTIKMDYYLGHMR